MLNDHRSDCHGPGGACRRDVSPDLSSLAAIVAAYLRRRRDRGDEMLDYCAHSPNLRIAKARAARCLLPDGRRHRHQRRIPIESLEAIDRRLAAVDLTECRDFDALYAVVADVARHVMMIGPLTIYDIAQRIGRFLKIEPTQVYLHAGTRDGAHALGLGRGRDVLEMSELPAELQCLAAAQVEDLLCIYKDILGEVIAGRSVEDGTHRS